MAKLTNEEKVYLRDNMKSQVDELMKDLNNRDNFIQKDEWKQASLVKEGDDNGNEPV